jgi:hypothetical protein
MTVVERILKVMEHVGAITKDRAAPTQMGGYKFRGIDDVLNALQPALLKGGVLVVPYVEAVHREDRVTKSGANQIYTLVEAQYHFYGAEGDKITAKVVGEGQDTGDKSANKAMSSAFKNAIIQVLSIKTEETERDSESSNVEPPAPPAAKQKEAKEPKKAKADLFDAAESWQSLKEVVTLMAGGHDEKEVCKLILDADSQATELPDDVPPIIYTLQCLLGKRGVKFTATGPQGLDSTVHVQALQIISSVKV